ncbi:unnamed protein product [Paramecium sonneborni]|uniref:GTP-binding protein n=1 Tax=Paramecium sonneborni TaxID=65129 RepID=A0A8S1RTS4_9CILI|nr:unnamed protein product [Paramecium sonneborni]
MRIQSNNTRKQKFLKSFQSIDFKNKKQFQPTPKTAFFKLLKPLFIYIDCYSNIIKQHQKIQSYVYLKQFYKSRLILNNQIGANGIIIIYDLTGRESFDSEKIWMSEIDKYAQEDVIRMLVGNKCDMVDKRAR